VFVQCCVFVENFVFPVRLIERTEESGLLVMVHVLTGYESVIIVVMI
jgi:hypothetical protein